MRTGGTESIPLLTLRCWTSPGAPLCLFCVCVSVCVQLQRSFPKDVLGGFPFLEAAAAAAAVVGSRTAGAWMLSYLAIDGLRLGHRRRRSDRACGRECGIESMAVAATPKHPQPFPPRLRYAGRGPTIPAQLSAVR